MCVFDVRCLMFIVSHVLVSCAAASHHARGERVGRVPAVAARAGHQLHARADPRQAGVEAAAALPGRVRLSRYRTVT